MLKKVDSSSQDSSGKNSKAIFGIFSLSLIIHICFLTLIGGAVIIQAVVPKATFTVQGEQTESYPDEQLNAEPEEDMIQPALAEENLVPMDAVQAPTESASLDTLVALETTTSFSAPLALGAPSLKIQMGAQPAGGGPSGLAEKSAKVGRSSIKFFGVQSAADRVAFLLDASGSMVLEQRGGKAGYDRLKAELVKMVENLQDGTEFNVYIFDSTVDVFKNKPVDATASNKSSFSKWIEPYMKEKYGNILSNYNSNRLKDYKGLTRLDLAITGAFEHGADTVFILTDGTPSVRRPPSDADIKAHEQKRKENATAIAELKKRSDEYYTKYKSLIAEMQQEVKKRNSAVEGRQAEMTFWIDGYKGLPPRPDGGVVPEGYWNAPSPVVTNEEILSYLEELYGDLYKGKGMPRPQINVVGHSVTNADRLFLQTLAKKFDGSYSDLAP
jgi:hypothetical protein